MIPMLGPTCRRRCCLGRAPLPTHLLKRVGDALADEFSLGGKAGERTPMLEGRGVATRSQGLAPAHLSALLFKPVGRASAHVHTAGPTLPAPLPARSLPALHSSVRWLCNLVSAHPPTHPTHPTPPHPTPPHPHPHL